jgi:hypothetical protein
MPPRKNKLDDALRTVAEREFVPPLSLHKNLVLDPQMGAVLDALREDPELHMNTSDAIRYLMRKGVEILLAEREGVALRGPAA